MKDQFEGVLSIVQSVQFFTFGNVVQEAFSIYFEAVNIHTERITVLADRIHIQNEQAVICTDPDLICQRIFLHGKHQTGIF
ncbi:hypothetical protein D3C86_1741670 [compost metagenome]